MRFGFLIFGLLASALGASAQDKLVVFPSEISLVGPRSSQTIIVMKQGANNAIGDVTSQAKFALDRANVASLSQNIIAAKGDGTAALTIEAAGLKTVVPVRVEKFTEKIPVSFTREIEPILTKTACNSGGCHGAQHGRGGFRLSLFGFDPAFDHAQIVQSAEGRRVVLADPTQSILLQKPILTMEHGGGERLKENSQGYRLLLDWLNDGATEPEAKALGVKSLEIYPRQRVMTIGERQTLAVTAVWSDGSRSDVTGLAQFDAVNEGIASVTPEGLVTAKSKGESHVMVRFGGQAAIMSVSLPYRTIEQYPKLATNNFIDEKLIAKWKDLGLTPSAQCSDDDFLRRMYLDLIGTLPTPAEVKAFQANTAADKRAKELDRVLNRPEFIDYWTLKWGDLLRVNRDALNDKGMWSFHQWIRGAIRDNKPLDEFVREIITAEGSTFTDGPTNYYRVGRTPDDWAETTSQVFLGVRMQCAKCHHHPFEKWSQEDYYGMTAFFTRLGTKNSQEFGIFGGESIVYIKNTGEAFHPRKRVVVKPHPLDGADTDDEFDRRTKLAEWMTAKENPFFAKNIVNRFWGYLMGRGLVEPLDDMRATNPAVNPELLEALAKDFIASKYNLKHLLKTIVLSRAYQAASTIDPGNKDDALNVHFTRYSPKRLSAETLADAIDHVTGTQEKYLGLPQGTRAIALPDTNIRSYLMDVFGRPGRNIVCECERGTQPNIAQAMHLLNGDFLNKKIADGKGRIEKALGAKKTVDEVIDEIYLSTVSRLPKAEERNKAKGWVDGAKTPKEGLQDLMWTLLNSREFLFNH